MGPTKPRSYCGTHFLFFLFFCLKISVFFFKSRNRFQTRIIVVFFCLSFADKKERKNNFIWVHMKFCWSLNSKVCVDMEFYLFKYFFGWSRFWAPLTCPLHHVSSLYSFNFQNLQSLSASPCRLSKGLFKKSYSSEGFSFSLIISFYQSLFLL